MAKPHKSKPKSSLFLCCFGSSSHETSMKSHHNHEKEEQKLRWFSRRTVPTTKSATKTVPLDASLSDQKCRVDKVHSSKSKPKPMPMPKSKSKPSLVKSQTPATNPAPPCQTSPVVPVAPDQTASQTRLKQIPHENHSSNNLEVDTCQQSSSSPAMSRLVSSIPVSKRQVRRLSSTVRQSQTTLNKPMRLENAKGYDPVFGMSAVLVTLIIMILWGRLCAILCTAAWLYFVPRFRTTNENDMKSMNTHSNDLDLDSEVYKRRVILEGLLERNRRGTF